MIEHVQCIARSQTPDVVGSTQSWPVVAYLEFSTFGRNSVDGQTEVPPVFLPNRRHTSSSIIRISNTTFIRSNHRPSTSFVLIWWNVFLRIAYLTAFLSLRFSHLITRCFSYSLLTRFLHPCQRATPILSLQSLILLAKVVTLVKWFCWLWKV